MRLGHVFFVGLLFWLSAEGVLGQSVHNDSINYKSRKGLVFASQGVLVIGSLVALNQAWYSEYNSGDFHFFNDNGEWLQMDKVGHITASNYLSNINYKTYRWAGYNDKKAAWFGFGITWGFLAAVEVMDGFSEGWGFSWGDLAANTLGGGLYLTQQLLWNEQRLIMKFSYHPTDYAELRPEILGSTSLERVLKDYNGQTHWLSANPSSFCSHNTWIPGWLNFAVGYSADGLLGGVSNVGEDFDYSEVPRIRQFYFAPDIDLSRIKTRSKWLNTIFDVLNLIKIPAPTLEIDQNGNASFFWFYF